MSKRQSRAIWEITLRCNLSCLHCGSRAAQPRTDELSTTEAFELIKQMAEVGIDEVALIGGEAFLRKDWLELAAEITRRGMLCTMVTGGYGISEILADKMKLAGIKQCSVSVDGMEETHDRLRGKKGSWQSAFQTLKILNKIGIISTCNTQINRLSSPELFEIYETIRAAKIKAWQLQMTVPMGNAADNWELLLQPFELLELHPRLAKLAEQAKKDKIWLIPGNNVGYFGPFERLLRGGGEWTFWTGCKAGLNSIGIEADGVIKGCPSLPTSPYTGGNIREKSLREIVQTSDELNFNLSGGTEHLWGFCKTCEFADICRGGCSWTAHTFFGKRGNNPYCYHRALVQQSKGKLERFILKKKAEGVPFDYGEFEIIEEAIEAGNKLFETSV